jgi:MFS family permease
MTSIRANRPKIAWRATAPAIILVMNSFVWYIFTYSVFAEIVEGPYVPETEKMLLYIAYYVSVAASALIGSKLLPRIRIPALSLWQFIGAIATLSLTLISSGNTLGNIALALFLGASVGVGLPSCLSYFADSTSVKNRGLIGGIIWGIVGFSVLVFAFLSTIAGQWEMIATLTIWRCLGCLGFVVLIREYKTLNTQNALSYLAIIRKREILLYLFPWLMFCIINFAEIPVLTTVFGDEFALINILEYAVIGIVATVAGSFADRVGRKRIVIAGFIMIGLEYAALSIFYSYSVALYLYLFLDGVTWGLLFSVFFMAIWGDLGENYGKEKYYTLGGLPFFLAGFLPILIESLASDGLVNLTDLATAAFSFASFFLFLAVLPLMYASETLPEKTIKDREIQTYLEKAQKEAEKYA